MESSQVPQKPAKRMSNAMYALMGIAVVATLIFAATTVLYYNQAKGYHDAKYKAQAVLVIDAYGAVYTTKTDIEIMLNDSWSLASRRDFALLGQGEANRAASDCNAIAYMYHAGNARYDTFYSLGQAMASVAWMIGQGHAQLNGPGHTMNATVTAALNTSAAILGDLYGLMSEGYDPEGDWLNEPYSMVDRMALDLIAQAVDSLNAALGG